MGKQMQAASSAPEYFTRDGKLTRRTFIKGVGAITVTSAMGFGPSVAPQCAFASQASAARVDAVFSATSSALPSSAFSTCTSTS